MEISQFHTARRFLLERGMLYFYSIFIAGYFLLPMAAGHRRVYYILVFPATVLILRELVRFYRGNLLAWLLLAYAGWMMLTLAWSTGFSAAGATAALWTTLNVLSFVAVTGFLWIRYPDRVTIFLKRLLWLAAGAALVSTIAWYSDNPFPASRLEPLGVMHHQNKSGAAYGIFLVLCIQFLRNEPDPQLRWCYRAMAVILGTLVILTQSRTALAGVCMGLLVLLGWRALVVILLGAVLSWFLLALNPGEWWHRVEAFSFRPGIWRQVLVEMEGHWLAGRGYLVDPNVLAYDRLFDHAHNGYLATLRDGGVVGLGLLLTALSVALFQALTILRQRGERIYLALLLYGMACIFMDFDRLLVHPKEMWLFLWAPIALVMATHSHRDNPGLQRFPTRETSRDA